MKNFNQNQGEMDSSGFYKEVTSHDNVNFAGSQYDGRFGSKPGHKIGGAYVKDADPDFGGINLNNQQGLGDDRHYTGDNMDWEKKNGAFVNPIGKFKDINDNNAHEVDLKNDNSGGIGLHEKSMDCYGG